MPQYTVIEYFTETSLFWLFNSKLTAHRTLSKTTCANSTSIVASGEHECLSKPKVNSKKWSSGVIHSPSPTLIALPEPSYEHIVWFKCKFSLKQSSSEFSLKMLPQNSPTDTHLHPIEAPRNNFYQLPNTLSSLVLLLPVLSHGFLTGFLWQAILLF